MNNAEFVNDIRMIRFAEQIRGFSLPRWERLPTLGLYMDQVVMLIEKELSPVLGFEGEAFITSSMINNYVKLGILSKPDKKKYSREHIACVLIITILKQSLAISDIRMGMDATLRGLSSESAYNKFCDHVEYAVRTVADAVINSDKETDINFRFNSDEVMITMAACCFATRMFTRKAICILREDEQAGIAQDEEPMPYE